MHYLIDGHNLIGRMPDIGLDDPDDEVELVLRLRSWSARSRGRRVTVIFDRGLPGGKDKGLSTSKVQVIFASSSQSADSILIKRITSVKNPRQTTLITSDNHILRVAGELRMPVLRAEEFALKLSSVSGPPKAENLDGDGVSQEFEIDPKISESEVDMWLNLFDDQDK